MSQAWYIYQEEQQRGPYTWEQVWQLARSGELAPDDLVWTEGMGDWAPARRFAALTSIPVSATVPPPPPPIGAQAQPPASPAPTDVGRRAAPPGASTWKLFVAVVSAIVVIAGAGGAAYLLLLRDRGLPAFPAATATPPATQTNTAVPPDLSGAEQGTQQAVVKTEEPTRKPSAESPTEPATDDDQDQSTAEPTAEPTSIPAVAPTSQPTVEPAPELTASAEASGEEQPGLPSPTDVVDGFVRATLGTVPGATLDYDRARVLMTVAYAAEFDSPGFVPLAYGIQDGPSGYEIVAEEISGSTSTVQVLGYWGADVGRKWRFVLQEEAGLWRVAGIEVLDVAEPVEGDDARSPFWQLNPVLEEFTVDQQGGWKLVVAFDQPMEDIGADFRIEYRREDDGSLAYSQESSGVIEAGRARLTLDSDWTGYDLSQLGFRPGQHRVVATIDGVEIASGELVVE